MGRGKNSRQVGCPFMMNRRGFIAACGTCAAGVAAIPLIGGCSSRNGRAGPKQIHLVYSLHAEKQPSPDWPNIGFDFRPVMDGYNRALREAFPGCEFSVSLATGEGDAKKILERDQAAAVDGYVVFQMNCWNRVVQTIATSQKPVLYVDYKYAGSGGFLVYTADFIRKGQTNVGFVSSSKTDDLLAAIECFSDLNGEEKANFAALTAAVRRARTAAASDLSCLSDEYPVLPTGETLNRLKSAKILAVRDEKSGPAAPLMTIPMKKVSFAEVNDAWEKADPSKAEEVAAGWSKNATRVIDVSHKELVNSAAMYLGMKKVLEDHQANAITINCLGGFYGGHIHAYPCLGFHELCNEGLVGACECDTRSTAAMVAINAMTNGRPGFISDPVMDTSNRQIIYAHCVAPNRMFGPEGERNTYSIMTHSEDRQGASLRSILPLNYLTTTIDVHHQYREIILHQGKAVANDPDDRACRTKLCVEPLGDFEKLFTLWDRWGWHRVTMYGDIKEPLEELASAIGWKMVYES